jgi:Tfp pilus assembly protein PilW
MNFSLIEILAAFMILLGVILLSIAIKLFITNTGIILPHVK